MTKLVSSAGFFLLAFTSLSISQPVFGPPQNLGSTINSQWYESDPFWDAPRKRLYFVRSSPMTGGEDIFYSDWNDLGWWEVPIPVIAINTGEIEHSPSVSPDGQKLYFVTFNRPGAQNAWDVWVSAWDSSQNNWGTPVELPCPVNTPGTEFSGRIGPDGKTLYLYSTLGNCSFPQQSGLLHSVFDSVNGWAIPQSLGPNINNGRGADYASVTQDSKWLYFDRDAVEGDGTSIFVSPWMETGWGPAFDLRPQIGERAGTPSVIPSGDSLFFATPLLTSLGNRDIFVMTRISTGVAEEGTQLPRGFELYQNHPNPFNAETHIPLFVSASSKGLVSLTVYSILGQPIRQLLKDEAFTGKNIQVWDGRDDLGKEVSSGIYLYVLRVGNERVVKKAVLIR